MATLSEKCEYRLSSSAVAANQSLFLVKLTDSSERALEKFLANQKRISRRPMIHFDSGASGSISIPSDRRNGSDKKDDDDEDDVFCFSIGQEANGSLDVTSETGRGQLHPVGSAKQRLTIHATSDSFSQTREKMALLEDASKQQQAKEIKPGLKGKRGNKLVTSKPAGLSASASGSKTNFVASVAKSLPSSNSSSRNSGGNHSSSMPEVGVRVKTKPEVARVKQSTPPPQPRSQESSSNLVSATSSLIALTGQPLRDRILHLLALKPYKKAELVLRLRNDGFTIPKEEPEALTEVLNAVAVQSKSKLNSYMLRKELFKEVDPKWEHYSDDERRQLAKQLAFLENVAAAKTSSSDQSSKSGVAPAGLSSTSAKRPSTSPTSPDNASSSAPVSKKPKRIAHRPKTGTGSSPSAPDVSPSENRGVSPPPLSSSSSNPLSSADQNSSSTSPVNSNPTAGKSYKTSFKTAPLPVALMNAKLLGASSGRPFAESTSNQLARNSVSNSSASTTKEESHLSVVKENNFVEKFVKIVSDFQRDQYAREFNDEYPEYFAITERLKSMANHAAKLDRDIDETAEGTPEREVAKKKLVSYHNEYKKKGEPEKKRAQYLQLKLAHIKRLIGDYEMENKLSVNNNDGDPRGGVTAATTSA